MRTTTALLACALCASMAHGQTLDYRLLRGAATEGSGDNNDFCWLWQRGDYKGMRNALSVPHLAPNRGDRRQRVAGS